jgi:hypothetical protein
MIVAAVVLLMIGRPEIVLVVAFYRMGRIL